MPKRSGHFIVFEGGEGVGKSTQIKMLANALKKQKIPFIVTREPGGTPVGEKLRKILKQDPMAALTEVFILQASRYEHIHQVILPALRAGKIVLCDRYVDSTLVYQSLVKGVPRKVVEQLNKLGSAGVVPDRVIIFGQAQQRLKGRSSKDKFDRAPRSFHLRVAKAYQKLASEGRHRRLLKVDGDRLTIHKTLYHDLESLWISPKYLRKTKP
jgi:dTMP kinase